MIKLFLSLMLVVAVSPVFAATVYLNSGSPVEGTITERAADKLRIEVSGVAVTYYKDEISRIEGDDEAARLMGFSAAEVAVPVEAAIEPVANVVPVVAGASGNDEKVLAFIEVFGTRDAMKSNFDQMMGSLSAEQALAFRSAFSVDEIIMQLIPLYNKYFTEADLDAFIAFYGSEAGKKLVASIPLIMKDSVDVSAQYFEKNMPEELKNAQPQDEQK